MNGRILGVYDNIRGEQVDTYLCGWIFSISNLVITLY